ncbi:hypothetical protein RIF29_27223 [Crotalaria pallida]|uniref:Trs120/TRAPPC9 N-terminal domain-containing protein n=1 Tax=Crotalaria pallida TaxID=3830 RepID=A0AAN9EP72_CROPI
MLRSMEPFTEIKVAVLPIGDGTMPLPYYSIFLKHPLRTIPLSSIKPFYTQHPNSPFSHHPWDSASLCFKFCQGYYPYKGYPNPKGPLDDFRAHQKTFAVIGLLHCPSSPDFDAAVDLFFDTCTKAYPYSAVNRCFALCPNDSQLEAGEKKGWNLTFVPDVDRSTFEFHLNTVMNEMAASLLMEFEKWVLQAESSGTILKTEIDSYYRVSPEEVHV